MSSLPTVPFCALYMWLSTVSQPTPGFSFQDGGRTIKSLMSGKALSSSCLKPPRSERLPWALWSCPSSILVLSVMSFVFLCESVLHQHGSGMFRIFSTPSSRSELTHPWVDQNQWSPPSQEKYVQDWCITQSVPKMKGFEQNSLGCSLKQGAALLYFWQSQRKMAMDKGTNRKALGSQVLFHLDSRADLQTRKDKSERNPVLESKAVPCFQSTMTHSVFLVVQWLRGSHLLLELI